MLLLMRRPREAIVVDGKRLRVTAIYPTHIEIEVDNISGDLGEAVDSGELSPSRDRGVYSLSKQSQI